MISVITPTVKGRELLLKKCLSAYRERTSCKPQIIVVKDAPTCGVAWNSGAEVATGDYIHYTADDLEPHENWDIEATMWCDRGYLPAPKILRPNGELESCGRWEQEAPDGVMTEMTRIPLMSREQHERIGPSLSSHYYTDNWISYRGKRCGYETVVCHSYLFTHHMASGVNDHDRSERAMRRDMKVFEQARRRDMRDA